MLSRCLHSGSSETSQISIPCDPHLTECERHSLDVQGRHLRVLSGSFLSHAHLSHHQTLFSYKADPSSIRFSPLHCGGQLQDPIISHLAWAGVFLGTPHHHHLTCYDPKQNLITLPFSLKVLFCRQLIGRRPKSLTWSARPVPCCPSPRLEPHSSSLPGLLAVPGSSRVLCQLLHAFRGGPPLHTPPTAFCPLP